MVPETNYSWVRTLPRSLQRRDERSSDHSARGQTSGALAPTMSPAARLGDKIPNFRVDVVQVHGPAQV
jgi:hypothetical protein